MSKHHDDMGAREQREYFQFLQDAEFAADSWQVFDELQNIRLRWVNGRGGSNEDDLIARFDRVLDLLEDARTDTIARFWRDGLEAPPVEQHLTMGKLAVGLSDPRNEFRSWLARLDRLVAMWPTDKPQEEGRVNELRAEAAQLDRALQAMASGPGRTP